MPKIIEESIAILSNAGLGMAMFSLGEYGLGHSKIEPLGHNVKAIPTVLSILS